MLSPGRQSSAWQGTKVLASTISLSHSPAEIPKGTSSVIELACTAQTASAVLLWIHPSCGSASLPVLQGPSHRGPLQQSELSLPLLPLCTLQIHPG